MIDLLIIFVFLNIQDENDINHWRSRFYRLSCGKAFVNKYPNTQIINLDKLTYAGNLENLKDIEDKSNYTFEKGDIVDSNYISDLFNRYQFDGVIHLAAESHVDRSITNPLEFIQTNVIGTFNLLHAAKNLWSDDFNGKLFYHVSTDEVYGSLGTEGFFLETTPYDPQSPYSSSKASSDHFVRCTAIPMDFLT